MKVVIYLNDSYPFGMANSNRMHLYAKGLIDLGNDVFVLIPRPTEQDEKTKNTQIEGRYDNVDFRYTYKTTIRSKSFFKRRIHDLASLVSSLNHLLKFNPHIILSCSSFFPHIILLKTYSLFSGAKLIREKSEVPFFRHESISKTKRIRTKLEFSLFDGLILITDSLKDFFINEIKLKSKYLVVPILIPPSGNRPLKSRINDKRRTLVYTGSLLDHKDGITTIIKSFALALKEYPDIKLIMTGNINFSKDKESILSLIEQLQLGEKIILTGYISKQELSDIVLSAYGLLLAKPDNRQNRYNMATKIGEYLLSGRPVIVSSVDPACEYLDHRKNVLIAEPNANSFYNEIKYILDNPSKADQIGILGKKAAIKYFDYKTHSQRIQEFIKQL
jgi:glycosyltransferase involved in cell wall biosynthesis